MAMQPAHFHGKLKTPFEGQLSLTQVDVAPDIAEALASLFKLYITATNHTCILIYIYLGIDICSKFLYIFVRLSLPIKSIWISCTQICVAYWSLFKIVGVMSSYYAPLKALLSMLLKQLQSLMYSQRGVPYSDEVWGLLYYFMKLRSRDSIQILMATSNM